ncbi:MAG: alpha/beta hydrolase-fold protein [Verrucomicrobiota bacterium]
MLTHPERFASASCLSGVFSYFGERGAKPDVSLTALLGPIERNKEVYLKYGIYNRLETRVAEGVHLPPMLMHCGTEDTLIGESRSLQAFLVEQNQKLAKSGKRTLVFQYKESPGKHDWPFWCDASVGIADFHWRSFEQAGKVAGP